MGIGDWYDRQGNRISVAEWGRLHDDLDYVRLGTTEIGPYVVSTVWLGLDHGFGGGPPVIFETMVFTRSAWNDDRSVPDHEPLFDLDCVRYSTEHQALIGHEEMCLLVEATVQEEAPSEAPSEPEK